MFRTLYSWLTPSGATGGSPYGICQAQPVSDALHQVSPQMLHYRADLHLNGSSVDGHRYP